MSKMTISFLIFFGISLLVFFNLGRIVDQTQPPVQSDIIVALGGDFSGCRLKKALQLYKQGYSKSGKFIYTSRDTVSKSLDKSGSRRQYLLNNGIEEKNIINIDRSMISNTMEEVFFIKKYMLYHHYKSVLIVSHPQHSLRIKTFSNWIAHYKKHGLKLIVAGCNPIWWNTDKYYENKISFYVTMLEIGKLLYDIPKYSPILIRYTNYAKSNKSKNWDYDIRKKLN